MNTELETLFVKIVERVVVDCFDGRVPEDPVPLVTACLARFAPLDGRAAGFEVDFAVWNQTRDRFAFFLVQAHDCIRREQEARWEN
jgi:hypothetical protein